jgi:hypothetical protein
LIILKSKDLAQTYNDNFSELWNKFDYYWILIKIENTYPIMIYY